MQTDELTKRVNDQLRTAHPTWKGNLGKDRLLQSIDGQDEKCKRLKVNGDRVVHTDPTIYSKPVGPGGSPAPKLP